MPRKAKAREDWSAAGLADLHRIRKTIDDRVLMANLAKAEPAWEALPVDLRAQVLSRVVNALTAFQRDQRHVENWPRRSEAKARLVALQKALASAVSALDDLDPRARQMIEHAAEGTALPDFLDDDFAGAAERTAMADWGIRSVHAWVRAAIEAVPPEQERRSDGLPLHFFVHRIITAYAMVLQGQPVRASLKDVGLVAFIEAALRSLGNVRLQRRTIEKAASTALAERRESPPPVTIRSYRN